MTPPLGVHLSTRAARRIALAAQGFRGPRPPAPGTRDVQRVVDTVGVVQIDSVNVLVPQPLPAVLLPAGALRPRPARPGPRRAPRRVVEYWAHEASSCRRRPGRCSTSGCAGPARTPGAGCSGVARDHPELVAGRARRGRPARAADQPRVEVALAHDLPRQRDDWGWNWSLVKNALEYLFWSGEVVERRAHHAVRAAVRPARAGAAAGPARRRPSTRRPADRGGGLPPARRDRGAGPRRRDRAVPARLLPALARSRPGRPSPRWSRTASCCRRRSRAGTARPTCTATPGVPRRVHARALLSPFDSLVWQRDRTRALFGFDYRIEIYVPEQQRVHGYYVLPFLLGEDLVARVDLKADRAAGVLRVRGAPGSRAAGSAGGPRRARRRARDCWPSWLDLAGRAQGVTPEASRPASSAEAVVPATVSALAALSRGAAPSAGRRPPGRRAARRPRSRGPRW